jgi:hypothetical protein
MTHHVDDDLSVEVYDYITADQIEEGDQIFYSNDPLEVKRKLDEGDTIMVSGYSYLSGDTATYFLNPDTEVGLWTA